MKKRCSGCGADLAMVGRSHRCIPRSRGGGEVIEQPRKAGNKAGSIPAEAGTSTAARLVRGIAGETPRRSHAGVVPGPRDKRSRDADVTVLAGTTRDAKPAGEVVTPGRQSTKGRAGAKRLGTRGPAPGYGGRPRKGEEHKTITAQRPWEKAGVSRRTWYRQQQQRKAK